MVSLPKLRKISFSLACDCWPVQTVTRVVLNTPSLEIVRIQNDFESVYFNLGEMVKILEIKKFNVSDKLIKRFLKLKNLECFSCTDSRSLKEFDVLKFKPDLKRIYCNGPRSGQYFGVIEKLLERKSKWGLPVKMYLKDELVKDSAHL